MQKDFYKRTSHRSSHMTLLCNGILCEVVIQQAPKSAYVAPPEGLLSPLSIALQLPNIIALILQRQGLKSAREQARKRVRGGVTRGGGELTSCFGTTTFTWVGYIPTELSLTRKDSASGCLLFLQIALLHAVQRLVSCPKALRPQASQRIALLRSELSFEGLESLTSHL